MYWIGLREGDVHWNISSPGWAKHAWSSVFAPWNAGATIFVYDYQRFDAKRVLETIVTLRRDDALRAADRLAHADRRGPRRSYDVALREVVGAGEPLNPEVIERVQARVGPNDSRWLRPDRDDRAGRQLAGPAGATGLDGPAACRVIASCCSMPTARRPTKARSRFRSPTAGGGEIATGTHGRLPRRRVARPAARWPAATTAPATSPMRDADGYITYVGRADDVFKSSDYRISPFELESALIEHPLVAEAAVVPSPDAMRLSVPKAFCVLRGDATPSREVALEIFRFVRERLPAYKRVRRLEFASCRRRSPGRSAASSCARSSSAGTRLASAGRPSSARTSSRSFERAGQQWSHRSRRRTIRGGRSRRGRWPATWRQEPRDLGQHARGLLPMWDVPAPIEDHRP